MRLSELSVRRPVFATVISLMLVILGLLAVDAPADPRVSRRRIPRRLDRDRIPRRLRRRRRDQDHAGDRGPRRRARGRHQDHLAERRRPLEHQSRVRSGARRRRGRERRARSRLARALGNLPEEAEPPEIGKVDFNAEPIIFLNLSSDTLSALELTDYAERVLVDRLGVLPGVARVRMNGARRYAMRVWLDREALAARQLTVADIESGAAPRERAAARRPARVDAARVHAAHRYRAQYRAATSASSSIGRGPDGYLVRLGEVADVRLAAENERSLSRTERHAGSQHRRSSRSRRRTRSRWPPRVKDELERLRPDLPPGTRLEVNLDRSVFIDESMKEVVIALAIALVLVLVVIYLFLGNLRATLIPAVTIPISIVAAFLVMAVMGFSINVLTLLGLVLAIGLVVDDSIVVLENIYRRIEHGEPPLLAAVDGSREIGFAVIATTRRAGRGVRADLVPAGRRRPAVPRVRLHDRRGRAVLGARRADADADDVLEAAARGRARSRFSQLIDDFFRRIAAPLRRRAAPRAAAPVARRRPACWPQRRSQRSLFRTLPSELAPAGGPRLHADRHDRAGRRVARIHGSARAHGRGHAAAARSRRRRRARDRARAGRFRRRVRCEPGARLLPAGAVGRARAQRGGDRATDPCAARSTTSRACAAFVAVPGGWANSIRDRPCRSCSAAPSTPISCNGATC